MSESKVQASPKAASPEQADPVRKDFSEYLLWMKRSEPVLTRSISRATERATTLTKTGARPKPD